MFKYIRFFVCEETKNQLKKVGKKETASEKEAGGDAKHVFIFFGPLGYFWQYIDWYFVTVLGGDSFDHFIHIAWRRRVQLGYRYLSIVWVVGICVALGKVK